MHFLDLPDELLSDIAVHLDAKSALRYSYSCKRFHNVTSSDSFWRNLLLACGFGKAWYTNSTCKQHLIFLLNHCKYCTLCRANWDTLLEAIANLDSSHPNGIVPLVSTILAIPPMDLELGEYGVYLPILSEELTKAWGLDTSTEEDQIQYLHEHPVLESMLITMKPVKTMQSSVQRHYVNEGGSFRLPRADERYVPDTLQTRLWSIGQINSEIGITVHDVMMALIRVFRNRSIGRGPSKLMYCFLAEPDSLVLVLGDFNCINNTPAAV